MRCANAQKVKAERTAGPQVETYPHKQLLFEPIGLERFSRRLKNDQRKIENMVLRYAFWNPRKNFMYGLRITFAQKEEQDILERKYMGSSETEFQTRLGKLVSEGRKKIKGQQFGQYIRWVTATAVWNLAYSNQVILADLSQINRQCRLATARGLLISGALSSEQVGQELDRNWVSTLSMKIWESHNLNPEEVRKNLSTYINNPPRKQP